MTQICGIAILAPYMSFMMKFAALALNLPGVLFSRWSRSSELISGANGVDAGFRVSPVSVTRVSHALLK